MKTIGLIGGMSWQSSAEYYRIINQAVSDRLGGLHSAKILMYSFNFDELEPLLREGRWQDIGTRIAMAAKILEKGGANLILICTNTMHKVADWVQGYLNVPLLHIADAAAEEIKSRGLKTVGLLGTRYTMEEDFYRERLSARHGIQVLVPPSETRENIDRIIFTELCCGVFNASSKERLQEAIRSLRAEGAQGIILGCTEIPLLIRQEDSPVPLFDTTALHAIYAVDLALKTEDQDA